MVRTMDIVNKFPCISEICSHRHLLFHPAQLIDVSHLHATFPSPTKPHIPLFSPSGTDDTSSELAHPPTPTPTPSAAAALPESTIRYCTNLLDQPNGALRLSQLVSQDPEFSVALFHRANNLDLPTTFLTNLIRETKAETAIEVISNNENMRMLHPTTLAAAVAAFVDKKSIKGVAALERWWWSSSTSTADSADLRFAFVRAYGKLKRLDSALRVFKRAVTDGAWRPSSVHHTNVLLDAVHTDARLTMQQAKSLLHRHHAKFDVVSFNILLKACMRSRNNELAGTVINMMKRANIEADDITWSTLIKIRSYCGDFEGVLAVRNAMEATGTEPSPQVWGSLLVACGAAQHHETALMLWREAKAALGGPAKVPTNLYNAMLTACNSCGQGERTLSILEEMKAAGVEASVKSYNLAIKACEGRPGQRLRLEDVAVALKLYEEMREAGMHPDIVTYGTLIELCAEGRQGALARRLRERMDEDGVRPNVVVLTSLLKALARAGLVDECLAVFSKMVWGPSTMRPNRITFRTVVKELREAGALGAALRAYEGMRKAHYAPSNADFQELIAAAAEAALAEGDPELQAHVAALCNVDLTEATTAPTSAGSVVIDLHGLSTLEARAAVLCTLSILMTRYQQSGIPPGSLTIITGRGEHSVGGQAVLPNTVLRLLSEELYMLVNSSNSSKNSRQGTTSSISSYEYGSSLDADEQQQEEVVEERNPGRIVIEQEKLLRWLRARVSTRQQYKSNRRKAAASLDEF